MTADAIAPAFVAGAMVLLVWLWRRGEEKRGVFFLAGALVAGVALLLAATVSDLERLTDEATEELEQAVEEIRDDLRPPPATPSVLATDAVAAASSSAEPSAGAIDVADIFPAPWKVEPADPTDDAVFYPPSDYQAWQPIVVASADFAECVLIDSTAHAGAMDFAGIEEALAYELSGFDLPWDARRSRYMSAWLSLLPEPEVVVGGLLEVSPASAIAEDMGIAFIDANEGSFSERHFLLRDGSRWAHLGCLGSDPPDDRWLSIAMKLAAVPLAESLGPSDR